MTDHRGGPWQAVDRTLVTVTLVVVGFATAACGAGGPATTAGAPGASTSAPTTSMSPIQVGPGARSRYTVEPQPRPWTCHYRTEDGAPLPDPACTPGAIDPTVTQGDIAATICRSGWTRTIRPPASVTGPEKWASARAYGYTGSFTTAEYDHLIPLELGGDPDDPANLWVEPNDLADATSTHNGKDDLENTLRELVCTGRLSLATARRVIATDWVATARSYKE